MEINKNEMKQMEIILDFNLVYEQLKLINYKQTIVEGAADLVNVKADVSKQYVQIT